MTTITIAVGGAIASREVLAKLLGPTADYLGEGARDLVQKGAENISHILWVSYEKVGRKLERPGQVNARVFKNVWDEGRFVEDVFSAEYFGGLLASARTDDGQDDSAVPLVAVVKSLSSFQIRLHFVIYALLAKYPFAEKVAESPDFWQGLQLFIPADELFEAMELNGVEGQSQIRLALTGLIDERVINGTYALRNGDFRSGSSDDLNEDGLLVSPNERGASLFLRALGLRGLHPELITSVNVDYSLSDVLKTAIRMPDSVRCQRRPVGDTMDSLRDDLEDKLGDIVVKLDEMNDELDERKQHFAKDTSDGDDDENA
jgi:hypothetical protein